MQKLRLIVAITLVLPQVVFPQTNAQLTQHIRGTVTDRTSGGLLYSAEVRLASGEMVTSTDELGRFVLNDVPIGRHTVTVSRMGYETTVINEVLVGSARAVNLDITLVQSPIALEEVTVGPNVNKAGSLNDMALLGAQMFSVEEARRFAGGMDDPARLVSAYAGVATPSLSNNGISVRGNAPALLQWRLEGVEIPNPNHFADLDVLGGGFLSALSANVLGNSDFFSGAFPAAYNNAVSGVFDMKLRNGNNQNYEHVFQLGILGIDFASEGPISRKNRSSYLINYRYSTTKLLEQIRGKEGMGGTLGYQDLNFRFNFPTEKSGTLSVWGTGLIDEVDPILDDRNDWKYAEDGFLAGAKQRSGAAGISHNYLFGNQKTGLETSLAATYLGNRVDETFHDLDGNSSPQTDLTANTTNLVLTTALTHKASARHSYKAGITWTTIGYDMRLDFAPEAGGALENFAAANDHTNLVSAYASSKINLGKRVVLSAGLNTQHLTLNNHTTVEPRASIRWQAAPRSSFAVGYGLHSRMEKPDVYFVRDADGNLPNNQLAFTKSHHLMLAYVYRISPDMNLKIEPYYQHLFNVPVTADGSYSLLNRTDYYLTEVLVGEGKGQNYGVDLTFEKYMTKGLYYMVTGSLFDSKYMAGDGTWYNTRYNRRFVLNGLIGKEWLMGRNMLGINLKATVMGGKRYTPVDEEATLAHPDNAVQYDENRMFAHQFNPMFIGDFSVSYKLNRRRTAHEFALKSVNATSQQEYVEHRYNIKSGEIEPYRPAISMFNVSYRIEF